MVSPSMTEAEYILISDICTDIIFVFYCLNSGI